MAELRVTQNTTAQDLQRFSEQAGKNSNIRGRKNEDGTITLYTSNKINTGIKELFTGHVTERRGLAREALNTILSNVTRDDKVGEKGFDLLTNIGINARGELKGRGLKELSGEITTARREGLKLERRISEALQSGDKEEIARCRDLLSGQLSKTIGQCSHDVQMKFSGTDGLALKETLVSSMNRNLGEDAGPIEKGYLECSPEVKQFFDEAYDMAAKNLPDKMNDDGTLVIDNKQYTKEKHLSEGAFGTVDLYKSEDGSRVVLKTPIFNQQVDKRGQRETPEQARSRMFTEGLNETSTHLHALDNCESGVIGMKGAIRTPGGDMLIALEFAPHGNVLSTIEGINKALNQGAITNTEVAQLSHSTLLKDMLSGLDEVHESGITHQDLKSPNYLIGEGGRAMVSDFGLSGVGPQIQTRQLVDNSLWLAPEVINDHRQLNELVKSTVKVKQENLTPIEVMREQFKGQVPDEDLEKMLQDVQQKREKRTTEGLREEHGVKMNKSSDTFALGVTAHQAWFRDDPFGKQKFVFEIDKNYIKFMEEGKPVFEPKDGKELTPQEEMVNSLMDPNPDTRLTPKEALNHRVFTDERVGSERIRDFLTDPIFRKLGGEGSDYQLTNEDRAQVKEALDKYLQGA